MCIHMFDEYDILGAMVTETLQRIQEIAQKGNTERTEEENSLYQVEFSWFVVNSDFVSGACSFVRLREEIRVGSEDLHG